MSPVDRQGDGGSAPSDWVEQTQNLTQAWTEAQSKIWRDWAAAAQPAAAVPGKLAIDWMQQWQQLVRTSTRNWSSGSPDTARDLVENLISGEQVFLSIAEMTLGMMKAVAPAMDVDKDWMDLLRRFADQMKQDMLRGQFSWLQPQTLASAGGDVAELWRLYTAELQRLYGPWASAYTDAARHLTEAGRGDPAALGKTYAGFLDAYELSFGRFLSAPMVGYSRESSERLLRGFDAWVDMNRAAFDFQTEIANEGLHAVEALVAKLVEMGDKGQTVTSLRQLFDLWSDTVDEVYYTLFGSDSFARLQGRYVNGMMEYRRRQAELLDEAMEMAGLPGRKEVDQVHARIHQMRREVRSLKKEMKELKAELATREETAAAAAAEAREAWTAASAAAAEARDALAAATAAEQRAGKQAKKAGGPGRSSRRKEGGAGVSHPDQT